MFTVKELRSLAESLEAKSFEEQMGPFALIQRPPPELLAGQGASEAGHTVMARPQDISQNILSLIFQFEELSATMLPPLGEQDTLSVGRLPDCDLVIDDKSVSKRHAVLTWNQARNQCAVKDLGSTNGTFLNDASLGEREAFLRDGDIVAFGEVPFWYLRTSTLYQKLSSISGARGLGARGV